MADTGLHLGRAAGRVLVGVAASEGPLGRNTGSSVRPSRPEGAWGLQSCIARQLEWGYALLGVWHREGGPGDWLSLIDLAAEWHKALSRPQKVLYLIYFG